MRSVLPSIALMVATAAKFHQWVAGTTSFVDRFRMVVALVVFLSGRRGNMFGVWESNFIGGTGDPSKPNKWNLGPSIASMKICHDWYIS